MLLFCAVQGMESPERITLPKIDESLMKRIGKDDCEAFEELYRKTGRTIYTYALAITKNPDDAQDIVQETFLKIRACAHLYKPMGKPMAWMFTIARNLARTRIHRSCYTVSSQDCALEDDIRYSYITDTTDKLVLESAFQILSESERQVILLHCVAGMKHQEIANNLEIPLSTALSRYNRSLKKLKKRLMEQGVLL